MRSPDRAAALRSRPLFLSLASLALAPAAVDWPCFLGPEHTARATVEGEALDWARVKPEIAWRVATGPGFGGVAIRDGEVFLLDREVGVRDVLRVFDLEKGEELWSAGYDAPGRLELAGSRVVPTVTADHVFTVGGFGRVTCFDRSSEAIAWSVDLVADHGGRLPTFGFSAAPLLVGDAVVVTPLGKDCGLLALDRESGEEVWATETVGRSHSTPALLELLGKEQLVFLSTMKGSSGEDEPAPTTISSFDPASGDLLWRTEIMLTRLPIPGPVKVDDERLFVTGGYRAGSVLLRISDEDGYAFEELFRIGRGSQVHTPILHEDHLYLTVNENWNHPRPRRKEGGLLCLGLDGVERWRTGDSPFFGRGSYLLLGGNLLLQDGFNGLLRVVRATPEGYQQVAEANLFERGNRGNDKMWAPMAFSGRHLLLRSQEELLCVRL